MNQQLKDLRDLFRWRDAVMALPFKYLEREKQTDILNKIDLEITVLITQMNL